MEGLRALKVAYEGALKARGAAKNSLHALVVAAPDHMREKLRSLSTKELVSTCASFRITKASSLSVEQATKISLRLIAKRIEELDT